jgi:hypothetical protein
MNRQIERYILKERLTDECTDREREIDTETDGYKYRWTEILMDKDTGGQRDIWAEQIDR